MSAAAQIPTKAKLTAKAASVTNQAQSGLVLRKCACGESAGVDDACEECREKKLTVQRKAINGAQPPAAPPSPGQPSNPGGSVQKGAGAGHSISRIRVSPVVPERVQAKLTVNEPGDKYEQEADQVAEQVMRMAVPEGSQGVRTAGRTQGLHIQRLDLEEEKKHKQEEEEDKEKEPLQTKKFANEAPSPKIAPELQTRINSIRGGGQPLAEATRAFMEPRFGYDFSQVRVHTDAGAAESAQAVKALAYTVGRDVVFGVGQYAPETATGKRLLAHELTHVVQQSNTFGYRPHALKTWNDSNGGHIQRQQPPKSKPGEKVVEEQSDEPENVDELVNDIFDILHDATKGPSEFHKNWVLVSKQIKEPVEKDSESLPELFKKDMVKRLNSLNAEQKKSVTTDLRDRLVESFSEEEDIDYQGEYDQFKDFVKEILSIDNYISMRDFLIARFSKDLDVDDALEHMNSYYTKASIVEADFPSKDSKVAGHDTLVHVNLQKRLATASKALKNRGWLSLVENNFIQGIEGIPEDLKAQGEGIPEGKKGQGKGPAAGKKKQEKGRAKSKRKHRKEGKHSGVGGLEVRANANDPSKLSPHTFGWAIDIDSKFNPNTKDFPTALVRELTGTDVFKDPSSQTLLKGGKIDVMLEAAKKLRLSSDLFKSYFINKSWLHIMLIYYLRTEKKASINEEQAVEMFGILEKAPKGLLNEAHNVMKDKQEKEQQASKPQKGKKPHPEYKAQEQQAPKPQKGKKPYPEYNELVELLSRIGLDPQNAGSTAYVLLEAQRVFSGSLARPKKTTEKRGKKELPSKGSTPEAAPNPTVSERVVNNLTEMIATVAGRESDLFKQMEIIQNSLKEDKKIEPKDRDATAETIAAHGFISLAPELIAALVGHEAGSGGKEEGGGLLWLGSLGERKGKAHLKDFMHFELRDSQKPPLF